MLLFALNINRTFLLISNTLPTVVLDSQQGSGMDRARASSWKEEDFLYDLRWGFACSPGRSGHTHDLPASRTPHGRRKIKASAT